MSITYLQQKNPSLYRYTNGEFYEFMSGVADDIPMDEEEEEEGPTMQSLEPRTGLGASAISVSAELLDEFMARLAELQVALRPIQGSVQTEQLAVVDAERCKIANYLLDRIITAANSPVQEEAEAGILLENDFSSFNGINRLRLNDKSGVIAGMGAKFALEKYTAAIQQLGIQPAIDEMNRQNQLYRTLASQRRDELRAAKPDTTTKELRVIIGDLFQEIYDRAFATNLLDRSEEAETFMERTNARIDEMIARLNNSGAQRGDSENEEDMETPPVEEPDTETPDTEEPETPPTETPEEPDDRPVVD